MNHAIKILQRELAVLCAAQEVATSSDVIEALQVQIEEISVSIDLILENNR